MSAILNALASAWIPDLVLLALMAYFRIQSGTWLAPSSFFGLYWFGIVTASLLAVDHRVPALGIWVLTSLVLAVQLGSSIGEVETRANPPTAGNISHQTTLIRLRKACFVLLLIAFTGLACFVWLSLDFFGRKLSVASLIQMAAKWTLLRYAEFTDPWPLRIAAVCVYPVALLGGMLTPVSVTHRDKLLGLSTLLPALVLTFLAGGRTAFLLALACWLGGSWASRVGCIKVPLSLFRKRTMLSFAALGAGLLFLFAAVNMFRGAQDTSDASSLFLEFNSGQIRNYMFGTPAAFAEWFDHADLGKPAWGGLTFQGLYDVLHIRPKTLGTYLDSESTVGLEGTNIFTMFRGLIQDFTFFGALLICGLWGLFSGRAYAERSLDVKPVLGLSAFYVVALYSPLFCPFAFNSTIFVWVVAWFVLRPCDEKRRGIWFELSKFRSPV